MAARLLEWHQREYRGYSDTSVTLPWRPTLTSGTIGGIMSTPLIIQSIISGIVATAILDLWQQLLRLSAGIPGSDWAIIGRWFAYLPRGRFVHTGITQTPPFPNELAIGWAAHYVVGIAYGFIYVTLIVLVLASTPNLVNGLVFGAVSTVVAWFIMMPGLGAGIFAHKTDTAVRSSILAFLAHVVFGLGLFLGATVVA